MSQVLRNYDNVIELDYHTAVRKRPTSAKRKVRFKGKRLVCTLLVLYLVTLFGYWHYKISRVNAEIKNLEAQKMVLQLEKNKLQEKKKLVQGEAYVEQMARANLGLVKPGEKVILLAEPGEAMPLESDANMEIYD